MRIMLNGRACSGKDSVGDILCEKYGFRRLFFAEPIYEIARKYFDMEGKDRELLITIGQKFREIEPDIWVDYLLKELEGEEGDVVITDIRQANEYIKCKEKGFQGIRVRSSLENRMLRCKSRDGIDPTEETLALWESEGEVGADPFEYYEIQNDGTYEELEESVGRAIKELKKQGQARDGELSKVTRSK